LNALTSFFLLVKKNMGIKKSENPFLKALASVGFQVVVLL
jgi:hypothetical protein